MDHEQILVQRLDTVGLITLHRPDRLNAWTPRMSAEMTDAIRTFNDDASIGAIVVTGEGRGFCAGADIGGTFGGHLDEHTTDTVPTERSEADWVRFCRTSKPLVAAINGPAIGVGLTMVLPFDRLVAARSAEDLGPLRAYGPRARARLVALPGRPLRVGGGLVAGAHRHDDHRRGGRGDATRRSGGRRRHGAGRGARRCRRRSPRARSHRCG